MRNTLFFNRIGSKPPLQAMKDWYKLKPKLFKKQPYYRPGCDSDEVVRDRIMKLMHAAGVP
jgi:hypothetical protein